MKKIASVLLSIVCASANAQMVDSTRMRFKAGGITTMSCDQGYYLKGFVNGKMDCQPLSDSRAQLQKCDSGFYMQGFDESNQPICVKITKTCPAGQAIVEFDAQGGAVCAEVAGSGGSNCGTSISDALKAYAGVSIPPTYIQNVPGGLAPDYSMGIIEMKVSPDGKSLTCKAKDVIYLPNDGNSAPAYTPSMGTTTTYNATTQKFTGTIDQATNGAWPQIEPSVKVVPGAGIEFSCNAGAVLMSFIAGISDSSRTGNLSTNWLHGGNPVAGFKSQHLADASKKCSGGTGSAPPVTGGTMVPGELMVDCPSPFVPAQMNHPRSGTFYGCAYKPDPNGIHYCPTFWNVNGANPVPTYSPPAGGVGYGSCNINP